MAENITYDQSLAEKYNFFHGRDSKLFSLQINKIKTYLNLTKKKTLIDCGCGAGRLLIPLAKEIKEITGVEYSKNMVDECNKTNLPTGEVYQMDFDAYLDNTTSKFDSALFSFTLHQIKENKKDQLNLLSKTFDRLKVSNILLITLSNSQMDESIMNLSSVKIDKFDRKRYLQLNELESKFNVSIYEEETNIFKIKKIELIDFILQKYISAIQILSNKELKNMIDHIDNTYPEIINYRDFYTYICLTK